MRASHQPIDPAIHEAARRIAGRFVHIIGAILREEERHEALTQAYTVAVEELLAFKAGGE